MKNWKTSLVGLFLGAYEILSMVPDISSLTWKQIAVRTLKALAIAAMGVLAKDNAETSQSTSPAR